MSTVEKSFLQRLKYLYKDLYIGKGYTFTPDAEKVLLRLVSFVQSGIYVKAEEQKFIAARWMLPVYDIHRAWNAEGGHATRAEKTFYSAKSRLSQKLERIFPFDIVSVLKEGDADSLATVTAVMSMYVLCMRDGKDVDFSGVFVSEAEKYCVGEVPEGLSLGACADELAVLSRLTVFAVEDYFSGLDAGKLAFIRAAFTGNMFLQDGSLNLEKLAVVKGLDAAGSGISLLNRLVEEQGVARGSQGDAVASVVEPAVAVEPVGITARERFGFADMERLASLLEKWAGMSVDADKFKAVAGKREKEIELLLSLLTEDGLKKFIVGIYPPDLYAALYNLEQSRRLEDKSVK